MTTQSAPRPPVQLLPASTILLVRDGPKGIEVFMVKRHHQIDFASGALVFPGGKVTAGDMDPQLAGLADGANKFSRELLSFAAGGIREAFEESGLLLARRKGEKSLIDAEATQALAPYRQQLDKGEITLKDFLERENLRLAVDLVERYAHWKTPPIMPKRFDTQFFIAAAPEGQLGRHDGGEAVDSVWTTPDDAIAESERWTIIFPTRMNLLRLKASHKVADALAASARRTPYPVEPYVEDTPDGRKVLRIQKEAGYGDVAEPIDRISRA
jgi:8-oxo-dGTP pyrophosphatase MutT (NUDIX family)